MGNVYAHVSDMIKLGISVTAQQEEAAEELLATASSMLRLEGKKVGKNLDELCQDEDFANAVKSVVIQSVSRSLNSISNSSPAVAQTTQSGLGYSASMTYLNAGQSLYFMKSELKSLGLKVQKYGALEVYGNGTAD